MIAHTLRAILRGFRRRKVESLLIAVTAILGSVGFAAALGFVHDYVSADSFYDPPDELYQLNDFAVYANHSSRDSWTLGLLTPWMRENLPAVRDAGRYRRCPAQYVSVEAGAVETLDKVEVTCVESTMFSMLSFPTVAGDPVTALERPDGAVVTDKTAIRMFGTVDVVGRFFDVPERDSTRTYTIGAVVKEIPANNHIQFDIAKSWLSQRESVQNQNTWQYVLLRGGATPDATPDAAPDAVAAQLTKHITDTIADPYIREVSLLPFRDVYMQTDLVAQHHGNQLVIGSIIVLGVILFLIATFNLFGLRVARIASSARQIGTRLSSGASSADLARDAAFETLVPIPATMLGVALLSAVVIPELNAFSPSGMRVGSGTLVAAAATAAVIHVVAAFAVWLWTRYRLTRTNIALLIADDGLGGGRRNSARKFVLAAQLALFALLLTGNAFLAAQFRYMDSVDRGHATPDVLYVELEDHSVRSLSGPIVEKLSATAGVESVVPAAGLPGMAGFGKTRYTFPLPGLPEEKIVLAAATIDTAFVDLMEIPIVAGRNVRSTAGGERRDVLRDVLLNEAAVEKLGFASPDDAVGWRPNDEFEVAGVVANFVHGSFHDAMEPMVLVTNPRDYWFGVAVVPSNGLSATGVDFESRIREAMTDLVPSPLFSMQSYARAMNAMYSEETRLRRALTWIARAALLLVVAGLWSISALIASRREREFGIRRVLGASDHHVFGLHIGQFAVLVVPAFVLGATAGFLLIKRWLDNFAFRSEAVLLPLAAAAVGLLIVTFFAVVASSIRFLVRRPIDSLRIDGRQG